MPLGELSELALGAEIAAKVRSNGGALDDVVLAMADRTRHEQRRRMVNNPRLAEQLLEAAGLGMTEDDVVANNKLAAEEQKAFGVGSFEEDVNMRRDEGRGYGVGDKERGQMYRLHRDERRGKKTNPEYREKVYDKFNEKQESQKFFDFGLKAFDQVNEDDKDGVSMVGMRGQTDDQIKAAARRDREQGIAAKAKELRYARGNLTEAEIENEARLRAGRRDNSPLVSSTPVTGGGLQGPKEPRQQGPKVYINPYGVKETYTSPQPSIPGYYRDAAGKGPEFDIRPQREMSSHPFDAVVTPEESKAAIIGELRARKEANRAGRIDRVRQENVRGRNPIGPEGLMIGQEVRTPRIEQLGKARQSVMAPSDMGVVIGKQRPTSRAMLVNRPDGSSYYVDARTGDLAGNVEIGPEQQKISLASQLNAPRLVDATNWIEQRAYENYGAQNFGDESVLASMEEKGGSGGGLRQVEISGTLADLDERFRKKGVNVGSGIRSIPALQAAVDSMIQANPKKKFFRREGSNMKFTDNPGVEEVLESMKLQGFEKEQIANALLQMSYANKSSVNLDAKSAYGSGGRFIDDNRELGSMTSDGNIVFGVDNPRRGGDSLVIAKAPNAVQDRFRGIKDGSTDAKKPFVAQVSGERQPIKNRVYKGMDPVQVRDFFIAQEVANREKSAAKSGRRVIPSQADERALALKIREAQEGNIVGRFNQDQSVAVMRAQPRNVQGRMVEGTPVPDNLRQMGGGIHAAVQAEQVNRLRNRAAGKPVKSAGTPTLLPRPDYKQAIQQAPVPQSIAPTPGDITGNQFGVEGPQMRTEPRNRQQMSDAVLNSMTKATGYNVRNALPAQGHGTPESIQETINRAKIQMSDIGKTAYNLGNEFVTSDDPRIRRARRISYGAGGGLAVLGGILGLNNDRQEEEQYR